MAGKMQTWVAYIRRSRVTSVGATNEAEARDKVRYQLAKPGRAGYLKAWTEAGEVVVVEATKP